MNAKGRKKGIFISYMGPDAKWAKEFEEGLRSQGADPYLPPHPVDSMSWQADAMLTELLRNDYLALILPRQPAKSRPWVSFQWGSAIGTEKRVVVISPRGSHVDLGELPTYARAMSFFKRGSDAKETGQKVAELLNPAEEEQGKN